MSDKTLTLDIVSAEEPIFSGEVKMLIVTGSMGELGIMPGHTQLLSDIKPGQVRFTDTEGAEQLFYVSGGMLEVQPYVVTIMADTVLRAEDIDEAAADDAKKQAMAALKDKKMTDKNAMLAQMAETTAMLRVVKELQKLRKS
jgi:F-type H+-transporting ATPase subunit epsilon